MFTRKDKVDLYAKFEITLEEALLGFDKTLTHLDGHDVRIKKTGVTAPGLREKFRGEGMPEHEYSSNHGVSLTLIDF